MDQRQCWMKCGSVLVHKSICHMLQGKSRERGRERVRRRSQLMRIWRLEDAPTMLLHSATYPGHVLWNHCPPPFELSFFISWEPLGRIPWKECGIWPWKMRHIMEIGGLRAWEMCKTVSVGKRVRGRDIMDGIPIFPGFQDRAKAVYLRFGLS